MASRKARKSSGAAADDLALVKAAAWAWYQHGSGNGGKPFHPLRETNETVPISLSRPPRRPTRYRQEAAQVAESPESDSGRSSNALLDVYEVERITRQLERLITAGGGDRAKGREKRAGGGFRVRRGAVVCGAREDVVKAHVRRPGRARAVLCELEKME